MFFEHGNCSFAESISQLVEVGFLLSPLTDERCSHVLQKEVALELLDLMPVEFKRVNKRQVAGDFSFVIVDGSIKDNG